MQNGVLILKVAGHGPGTHQFLVSLERPINEAKASSPILSFKDAQRETGEVLVEGQGTLELTAKESGGLKRLDIREINPYLRALSRYSLQAAFRYHRQTNDSPALALEWNRFPDSSVLAAIAERATVTTLVDVSNYCGTPPTPPVRITFDLGADGRLSATPPTPTDDTVPPCNGPTVAASIQMQPWSRG